MGCCEWCSTHFRKPYFAVLTVLQIGVAIAIINIIYWHLTDLLNPTPVNGNYVTYSCGLGQIGTGPDLCIYGYIVNGVSILLSLLLVLSLCFVCKCWTYADFWFEWILSTLGTIWWVAAAIVVTSYLVDANGEDIQVRWRNVVCILAWINALLFFLLWVVTQFRLCYKVCGCCGGAEAKRLHRLEKEQERAQRRQKEEAAAIAAATATAVAAQQYDPHLDNRAHVRVIDMPADQKPVAQKPRGGFFGFGRSREQVTPAAPMTR